MFCSLVFITLTEMMIRNKQNQEDMITSSGFSMISYFLKQINSENLSSKIFDSIQKLLIETQDKKFRRDLVENFLMDFDIWIYCRPKIQKAVLSVFSMLISCSQKKEDVVIKVHDLVDIMRVYYWLKPDKYSRCQEDKIGKMAGEFFEKRPNTQDIREMRTKFLHIIELMMNSISELNNSSVNLEFLLVSCFVSQETEFIHEIIQLIQRIFTKDLQLFGEVLPSIGFMDLFIFLMDTQDDSIRENCLQIINKLEEYFVVFNDDQILKKKMKLESRVSEHSGFNLIHDILVKYPLTTPIANTLFSLIVNKKASKTKNINKSKTKNNGNITIHKWDIQNTFIFKTIFQLIGSSQNHLGIDVLKAAKNIILWNQQNKNIFVSQFGWQKWMIELIGIVPNQQGKHIKDARSNGNQSENLGDLEEEKEVRLSDLDISVISDDQTTTTTTESDEKERVHKIRLWKSQSFFIKSKTKNINQNIDEISNINTDSQQSILELSQEVLSLFKDLHLHSIFFIKDGWKHLETTISLINLFFISKRNMDHESLIFKFLEDIFEGILEKLEADEKKYLQINKIFIENMYKLIVFLDVFHNKSWNESQPKPTQSLMSPLNRATSLNAIQFNKQRMDEKNLAKIFQRNWMKKKRTSQRNKYDNLTKILVKVLDQMHFFEKKAIPFGDQAKAHLVNDIVLEFLLNIVFVEEKAKKKIKYLGILEQFLEQKIKIHKLNERTRRIILVVFSHLMKFFFVELKNVDELKIEEENENIQKIKVELNKLMKNKKEGINEEEKLEEKDRNKQLCLIYVAFMFNLLPQKSRNYIFSHLEKQKGKNIFEKETTTTTTKLDSSNEAYLMQIFMGRDWKALLSHNFLEERKKIYEEIMKRNKEYNDRQAIVVENVKHILENEYKINRLFAKTKRAEIKKKIQKLVKKERNRIDKQNIQRSAKYRFVEKKCNRILRGIIYGRGPWSDELSKQKLHWKLDFSEDHLRRRIKLKPNHKYKDHKKAGISRGRNMESVESPIVLETERELSRQAKESMTTLQRILERSNEAEKKETRQSTTEWAGPKSDTNDSDRSVEFEQDIETERNKIQALSMKEGEQVQETLYRCNCWRIYGLNKQESMLEISTSLLSLVVSKKEEVDQQVYTNTGGGKEYYWQMAWIIAVFFRRYIHKETAIEIFFQNGRSLLINLENKTKSEEVFRKIISHKHVRSRGNVQYFTGHPRSYLRKLGLKKKWRKREISNFEYLMHLNTISGRSYNDFGQYPVFPWVLSNYTSSVIDLKNTENFRDLSKPIGALNEERLKSFKERYNSFNDDMMPFLYGTHYSSPGVVLWYLIRMEPFTSFAVQYQGGKFDRPDRIFHSLELAWQNCLRNPTDLKELIPEFFYLPDFLENSNSLDLGALQSSNRVLDDVELPRWASSPEEFIRMNRDALESEYVSENLNQWIDLIFGYQQQGKEAEKANNVFHYLTYPNLVNFDKIDPRDLLSVQSQIENYGQTPTQLFYKKHPKRISIVDFDVRQTLWNFTNISSPTHMFSLQISENPIVFVKLIGSHQNLSFLGSFGRVVLVDKNRVIHNGEWIPLSESKTSFPFLFDQERSAGTGKSFAISFSRDMKNFSNCMALSTTNHCLMCCGFWDCSFKSINIENLRIIQNVKKHQNIVTCLAIQKSVLVTGSKDTTVIVWRFDPKKGKVKRNPVHILVGHDDEVSCVDISIELNIVISGSKDGTCIISTLKEGEYVRTFSSSTQNPVSALKISSRGYVVVYSEQDMMIRLFSINGKFLKEIPCYQQISSLQISKDNNFIILGGNKGFVEIRSLYDLLLVHQINIGSPIFSLEISESERFIIVGTVDGKLFFNSFEFN
eukprot:Anaeramoba_ignava/a349073_49.p1 GENE.a349073_49~~a349073_49.p1  ORF type:complete len:1897 (-),score=523.92 a349073_49:43-5580(-)